MINSPEEYEKYHLLPKWYNDVSDCTPNSVWEDTGKGMLEYHTDPERKMELEAFKKRGYRWKEIKG